MRWTATAVALIAVSGLASVGASAAAETPAGVWMTQGKDSKIRISSCGKSFCATILWARGTGQDVNNPDPSLRARPVVGIDLSRDIRPDGEGGWKASMYNPQNGKTYQTTLEPKGRELEVGGCILGGLLCGSETWQRAAESTGSVTPARP